MINDKCCFLHCLVFEQYTCLIAFAASAVLSPIDVDLWNIPVYFEHTTRIHNQPTYCTDNGSRSSESSMISMVPDIRISAGKPVCTRPILQVIPGSRLEVHCA